MKTGWEHTGIPTAILPDNYTVVLSNGSFPSHNIPIQILKSAQKIICCDGAVGKLTDHGFEPTAIVGDLDSISVSSKKKYADRIFHQPGQSDNDLSKTLNWCASNGIFEIVILGATGGREDHTLGNIFLLFDYFDKFKLTLFTDTGLFKICTNSEEFLSYEGQQVSLFAADRTIKITTRNLKYPLNSESLDKLHSGTLNESINSNFQIELSHGALLIYRKF